MIRRLDFLEEQSQNRMVNKEEPLLREIDMLKAKLENERLLREELLNKKNKEVTYFKKELEILLEAMKNRI